MRLALSSLALGLLVVAAGEARADDGGRRDDARDGLLLKAAAELERARDHEAAIAIWRDLITRQPDAPASAEARFLLGRALAATGDFEGSAEAWEAYAVRHRLAGEPRSAAFALERATSQRLALGQEGQADADARLYEKLYGARPELADRAAALSLAVADLYERHDEPWRLQRQLEVFLATWGDNKSVLPDRALIAHARLGELLWERSCPLARRSSALVGSRVDDLVVDGGGALCVTVEPAPGRPRDPVMDRPGSRNVRRLAATRCGGKDATVLDVRARSPVDKRAAQLHFEAAARAWAKLDASGGGALLGHGRADDEPGERWEAARRWATLALFRRADADWEQLLATPLPAKVTFHPANDPYDEPGAVDKFAGRRVPELKEWVSAQRPTVLSLAARYAAIAGMNVAPWSIAAWSRQAALEERFAARLRSAPIPSVPGPPPFWSDFDQRQEVAMRFCGEAFKLVDDWWSAAEQSWARCVAAALRAGTFDEHAALCEQSLRRRFAADYRIPSEITPPATHSDWTTEPGPLLRTLDDAR